MAARHLLIPALAALVAGLALVGAGTAGASAGNCYSREGCTEEARSASSFVAGVGVNTHLGYSQTVYWTRWADVILPRLKELGVSHVRDGTFPAEYPEIIGPTIAARYNELNASGIKGNLLVGHEQPMIGATSLQDRLDWIKIRVPDFTTSIEGSNEFDTWGGSPERVESLRAMQCEIYQRVKSDPVLASRPVIGPSSGNAYSDDVWYREIGDLSDCLDKGNLHAYAGSDPPHRRLSRDLSVAMAWARMSYGDKPLWATETGYWNTTDAEGVSEAAAGTYVPRALMENFRRGLERSQLYELIDLETGTDQVIDNYGLLRTDGTRKPAFTATRNLLSVVRDSTSASGSLGFGIVCTAACRYGDPTAYLTEDGPIRHVLLKHSSGAYFLAVWSESKVWDSRTKTDTPKTPQAFTLHLHEAPAKVEIFNPSTGTAPLSTDSSGGQTVNTVATDSVRLIKITPAAAKPASITAPPSAAATDGERAGSSGGGISPAPPSSPSAPPTRCSRPKAVQRVTLSRATFPKIRAHLARAVNKGWPRILVVNRKGALQRRNRLLKGSPARRSFDRQAYPPAIGRGRGSRGLKRGRTPTGWRADIAYIPSSESRTYDSLTSSKLMPFCDGTRFRYVFR